MNSLPLSFRKAVRALVEEARTEGPRQEWKETPVKKPRYRQVDYKSMQKLPAELWAPEITQTFAEGVLEAVEQGFLEIAYLRARNCAAREESYSNPGIYARLFALVRTFAESMAERKEGLRE